MKPLPPYDEQYRRQQWSSDPETPAAGRSGRWELFLEVFAALVLVLAGVCAVQSVNKPKTLDLAAVEADASRATKIDVSPSKDKPPSRPSSVSASPVPRPAPRKPVTAASAASPPAAHAAEKTPPPRPQRPAEQLAKAASASRASQSTPRPVEAGPVQQATQAKPQPNDPVYLDDLRETGSKVGQGVLGKRGDTGYPAYETSYGQKVFFRGRQPSHALSLYPPGNGVAYVAYSLGGQYRTFRATAAILDTSPASARQLKGDPFFMGGPASPLAFRVIGDGKLLWESRPMQKCGQSHACEVTVEGVNIIELQVSCPANNYYSWAAWLDPSLEK
jgi:hypothetical protein